MGSFPSPLSSHRTDGPTTPVNLADKHQEREAGIGQGKQQLCDVQLETSQWGLCCTAAATAELKICLTLLKSHFAWFVCTGCYSLPGVYHTFSSCLQNAVITNCKKPASSSSDQSETSTAMQCLQRVRFAEHCCVAHGYCSEMLQFAAFRFFFFSRVLGLGLQKCFVTIATGAHTSLADGHDRNFCQRLTWPFPMQICYNKPEHFGGPVFIYSRAAAVCATTLLHIKGSARTHPNLPTAPSPRCVPENPLCPHCQCLCQAQQQWCGGGGCTCSSGAVGSQL